jgi:hypothetical protein
LQRGLEREQAGHLGPEVRLADGAIQLRKRSECGRIGHPRGVKDTMQAAEPRLGLLHHIAQLCRIADVGRGHEHLCPERFEAPREVLLVGRK